MIRLFTLSCLLLLFTLFSYGQSINISLPATPVIESIPAQWKGYNHGSNTNVSDYQTNVFYNAFSKMNPGIIRWPGGNPSNNYVWMDHLSETGKLNLKNVLPFLDTFNVALQIVVNFGNGSAADAAELVSFCNSTDSNYVSLRQNLLNSPNPINVKYWEIGNESTDAWSFGWSWLGFQENIRFQTGVADNPFLKNEADDLYYYGGELFREGWVEAIGLDNKVAILGHTKLYSTALVSDVITVKFPSMDTTDTLAVRVYRTANFDNVWASTATQQQLYDSIANLTNLLPSNEFSWTATDVTLIPNGGLNIDDFILIEYNSIGHDGAFAYRDAMKTADASIEIGYNVKVEDIQANNSTFQQDFAASPPNFMIKHPYSSGSVVPAIQNGYFQDAAFVSQSKVESFLNFKNLWNQREVDWGIPNEIGLSLTEWNVALFDQAPAIHPIRGITCGLYVADFWARIFEYGLNDSLDLRVINHFALSAQGNNFIHLLHPDSVFSVGVEGKATTMVMQAIGEGMFPITLSNNPQIDVITNDGQGDTTSVTTDAIPAWGGVGANNEYVNVLLINRDDSNSHVVDIDIPAIWQADSVIFESLYGEIVNEIVYTSYDNSPFTGSTYSAVLPPFSLNTVRIHITNSLGLDLYSDNLKDGFIYPNPSSDFVYFTSKQMPISVEIFNNLGQKVNHQTSIDLKKLEITNLEVGIYFIRVIYSDNKNATYKFIKK
ncbi:MAG: hypothetical protein ACI8QQ_002897 [Psychroserpens sp.]|jgi:hypothetical protein